MSLGASVVSYPSPPSTPPNSRRESSVISCPPASGPAFVSVARSFPDRTRRSAGG